MKAYGVIPDSMVGKRWRYRLDDPSMAHEDADYLNARTNNVSNITWLVVETEIPWPGPDLPDCSHCVHWEDWYMCGTWGFSSCNEFDPVNPKDK